MIPSLLINVGDEDGTKTARGGLEFQLKCCPEKDVLFTGSAGGDGDEEREEVLE